MQYSKALEYLNSFSKYDIKLGLDRIKYIMSKLNIKTKYIHIAGTNGKGSISKYINNILISEGYNVGLYQSPEILDIRENIQINNKWISKKDFAKNIKIIKNIVDKMQEKPTYFEIKTALALLYFKDTDFACIEVGMGGEYDATNVVTNKLVSVITAVDMDHLDFLGNSIEKIAKHKVGIINSPYTVVYPFQYDTVDEMIKEKAKKEKSEIVKIKLENLNIEKNDIFYNTFTYKNISYIKKMIGKHQIYNAITAIEVINCLKKLGYNIYDESIKKGIRKTFMPARLEYISKKILLDGSHNIQSTKALKEILEKLKDKKIIAICSILKDKNYEEMFKIISNNISEMIIIPMENKRAENIEKLYLSSKKYINNTIIKDNILEAMSYAKNREYDLLVIFGSLYLTQSVRKVLNENN